MGILHPDPRPAQRSRRNPRDGWPRWTDANRYTLAPTPAGPRSLTDAEFRSMQLAMVARAAASGEIGGASC